MRTVPVAHLKVCNHSTRHGHMGQMLC